MALDKVADKLMVGMVVASLVVGLSLVLQATPFELPKEIGWIAVLGYTAAVLCGFYAIYHGDIPGSSGWNDRDPSLFFIHRCRKS